MKTIVVVGTATVTLLIPFLPATAAGHRLPEQAQAILNAAPQLELYSLEPEPDDPATKAPRLRGWVVLGKTVVKRAGAGKGIVDALEKGIASPRARGARCFDPR